MNAINLTTIALFIFVVSAGMVLLRGGLRILLGCVVLGASAWLAFRVWRLAPDLVRACCGQHLSWLAWLLPLVTFVVVFILGRMIMRFLTSPFRKPVEERSPLTLWRLLAAAVLTLVPTFLVGSITAALIYHAGSVAEIRNTTASAEPTPTARLLQSLKSSIEKHLPAGSLKWLDPLADPSRVQLAKAIAEQSHSPRTPVIDPQTGRPIPRAIIVDDPELQNLAREGKFATLLRSPLLTRALDDPKVKAFLKTLGR